MAEEQWRADLREKLTDLRRNLLRSFERLGESEAEAGLPDLLGRRLFCAACRMSDAEARRWRRYLTDADRAVPFCPPCCEREFA